MAVFVNKELTQGYEGDTGLGEENRQEKNDLE